MSLRSLARTDFDANLTADGDDVTFTPDVGDPFTIKGKVARIESYLDPQLGIMVFEKRTAVSVSMVDMPSDSNPNWLISTTDSEGNTVTGKAIDPRFDRTIGFVTYMMEAFE